MTQVGRIIKSMGVHFPKMFKVTLSGCRNQLRNFLTVTIRTGCSNFDDPFYKGRGYSFVKSPKFIFHFAAFNLLLGISVCTSKVSIYSHMNKTSNQN